jgi:hypothetical protein
MIEGKMHAYAPRWLTIVVMCLMFEYRLPVTRKIIGTGLEEGQALNQDLYTPLPKATLVE